MHCDVYCLYTERLNVFRISVCRELLTSALRSDFWSTVDLRRALENIQLSDMRKFSATFYVGVFVEGIVEGNLTKKVSLHYCYTQ